MRLRIGDREDDRHRRKKGINAPGGEVRARIEHEAIRARRNVCVRRQRTDAAVPIRLPPADADPALVIAAPLEHDRNASRRLPDRRVEDVCGDAAHGEDYGVVGGWLSAVSYQLEHSVRSPAIEIGML